jgi:hypothetical protein
MNNLQPPDDARSSMFMLAWVELLILAIFIVAVAYFGGRALYYKGYNTGVESVKCELHQCMSHVIRYSKCDKTSNYPKLSNYRGK